MDAAIDSLASANDATEPAKRRGPSARTLLAGAVALALAAAGAAWIAMPASRETTDDAYVAADASEVAPKVRGLVSEVLVRDNQPVRAGAPLVRIDAEEFDSRSDAAGADLADALADVASAKAGLASLTAEERLAAANIVAAGTTIRAASAEAERAEADRLRYETLAERGFATRSALDSRRAAAIGAEQAARRSQALLSVSEREAGVTAARRATLQAGLAKAEARVAKARAALGLARQDRRHSLVLAPIDGVVGNRQVQRGDYVQPGTRLLSLVPLHDLYVTAYFKETQLRHMHPGQKARVHIDALGGDDLAGRVESFAPGSGSTFSLLPFEPGTGSFTKIVQRVPVRIRLDPGQPAVRNLRPGLSVTASVSVRD